MKPKFTLRDIFWLMIVVGLATGWWLEWRRPKFNAVNSAKINGFERATTILTEKTDVRITVNEAGHVSIVGY